MKLHPRTEDFGSGQSELVDKFRDFFCGPQDYAVIGWKADAAGPADCFLATCEQPIETSTHAR